MSLRDHYADRRGRPEDRSHEALRGEPPLALPADGTRDDLPAALPVTGFERDDLPYPAEVRAPHPNFWWSLLWCLGFLLLTQIPAAVMAVIVVLGLATVTNDSSALYDQQNEIWDIGLMAGLGFAQILVIGVSILALTWVHGLDWPRKIAVRWPSLSHVGLALLGFPALVVLSNGIYVVIKGFLPGFQDAGLGDMETMLGSVGRWPWPLAVLIIGLGPGIGEELWCRGFLGRGLVGTYGPLVGVLLTGFLFGLIHVEPRQATVAMLMGFVLHFSYLMSRSILVPILLHFLNNGLAVVASQLPYVEQIDHPEDIAWPVYVTATLLLVAVAVAWYHCRARLAPEPGLTEMWWRPSHPGVETPPADSGVVVTHPPLDPVFDTVTVALFGLLIGLLLVLS